eukprot:GILI01005730.1.p1 GENE.GILI01005730.1~~GILI01005730.1.p1  ORF type:complete len:580 (-),score=124.90 GILI01005730.1:213-1952(-)
MSSSHPHQAAVTFELLEGYKVEKFISKGSYGEVYQALRQPTEASPSGFSSPSSAGFANLAPPPSAFHHSPPKGSNTTPSNNPLHHRSDFGAANADQYHHPHQLGHFRNGSGASSVEPGAGLIYGGGSNARAVVASSYGAGDASDDGAFGTARPSQRSNTQNPRAMISGNSSLGSPLGLGLSGSRPPPMPHPQPQKVAIKVVRDYARRGTSVQGSDRYISRYTKKIAREVQLLQYFNGCKEFVPVMDMYLSANKHDLYIVMKMYDYSLYTFIRREVAAKKLEEEEMRSPKKVRPEGSPRTQQLQAQQPPPAPVRKGLRRIMTEKQTRMLTTQLLSGLAKMASVGSAHRDLSSGNVLYDPNTNRASICDFGLSRANMNSDLAQTTNVVTAPYRSPELLLLVNKYDGQKVDVWSVGILMMEMLIGCPPVFEQNDNLQREGVFRNLCYCDMDYWIRQGAPTSLLENERGRKFDHYNKYPKFIERLESEKVLSPPGIEVLKACLEQKPEDRKSCNELLQMPWFTTDNECMRLLDELTVHSDADKAFQRRTLPNIEDGFGREDHIRFIEGVVKKSASMKQHFTHK